MRKLSAVWVVAASVCAYVLIFTLLCSLRYRALFSWENGDDAVYNQCAYNTAHGRFFASTVKGDHILFEHVHPIILVYAAGYVVFPRVYTWFFITSLLLGAGAWPVFQLGRELFRNAAAGVAAAWFYLLYAPLHAMNLGVLEPEKLAIPFWLFAWHAFRRNQFRRFWLFAALAVCCKENMALILCMFGLYAIWLRRPRRWIVTPIVAGSVWLILALFVIMPWLMPRTSYQQEYLRQIAGGDSGFSGIIKGLAGRPLAMIALAVRTDHLRLLARLIMPTAGLCLLAPEVLSIALPGMLQCLLTTQRMTTPQDHWLTGMIPFVVLAAVIGASRLHRLLRKLRRLPPRLRRCLPQHAASLLLLALLLGSTLYSLTGADIIGQLHDDYLDNPKFMAVRNNFDPLFYRMDEDDRASWRTLDLIPENASAAANYNLLLPLSHRAVLYEFGHPDNQGRDLHTDYIMLRLHPTYFGGGHDIFLSAANLEPLKALLLQGDYRIVSYADDLLVLTRDASTAGKPDLLPAVLDRFATIEAEAAKLAPLRGSKETF